MDNNKKIKSSTKYLVIGLTVLFLSIIGSSVAYYLARVQATLSGRAAGTELTIDVQKISDADGDLIPLDNDIETLNKAILGYGNNTSNFDSTKSCIDINGYSVCQIYKITLTNNGTVPLTVNGNVELYGKDTPNIDCAKMDNNSTITNNNSCTIANGLANKDILQGNSHLDYYVIIYINNLNEAQYDSGEFNGTVTFTTEDGREVKGRFKKGDTLVEYITKLYNTADKTVVNAVSECEKDEDGSCTYDENYNVIVSQTIDYNYATSVNLMNDRLGGTSSLDGGNIRYYGSSPNNYIDIGDVNNKPWNSYSIFENKFETSEQCYEAANCETNYATIGSLVGQTFNNEDECNNAMPTILQNAGVSSIDEICSPQPILWRIIGVFDGKARIIRNDSIGQYSWDTSSSDINDGLGINEWSHADIMKLLNSDYNDNKGESCNCEKKYGWLGSVSWECGECNDNVSVNNSLYWNSENGNCYMDETNKSTACDFRFIGLSEIAKEYIINQTINLGGINVKEFTTSFPNTLYSLERDNNIIQNNTDGVKRTTKWLGKVALPYVTDYLYASDLSFCTDKYSDDCKNNNWLYRKKDYWTISPSTDNSYGVYCNESWPDTVHLKSSKNMDIMPTLVLDPTLFVDGGSGSKENPYKVSY